MRFFNNNTLLNLICISILSSIFLLQTTYGYAQNCACTDYLYVNDIDNDLVHKFPVNADGSLAAEVGNPWLSATIEQPHGLGLDLNGNLYINDNVANTLLKLTCDGTVISTDFIDLTGSSLSFWEDIYNIVNAGNTMNTIVFDPVNNGVSVFVSINTCDGTIENEYVLPQRPTTFRPGDYWGIADNPDGGFYIANGGFLPIQGEDLIIYDLDADLTTLTTVLTADTNNGSDNWEYLGIDTDEFGNFYVLGNNKSDGTSTIFKIDPTGNIIDQYVDIVLTNDGFNNAWGLIYNKGFLYLASRETCVFVIDAGGQSGTMTPMPAFTIPGTSDDYPKAIGIATECCPNPPTQDVTINVCGAPGEKLSLNELFNCEGGFICEGPWVSSDADSEVIFSDCDQSIEPTTDGCYNYAKTSTQSGNKQCPSFTINLEICIGAPTAPVIAATDNDCATGAAGAFTVTTPCSAGSTLEWSTDGGTNWSTTMPAYDAINPVTVMARCYTNDTCLAEGNTITSAPEECCPVVNCINQFGAFTFEKRRIP